MTSSNSDSATVFVWSDCKMSWFVCIVFQFQSHWYSSIWDIWKIPGETYVRSGGNMWFHCRIVTAQLSYRWQMVTNLYRYAVFCTYWTKCLLLSIVFGWE